MTEPVVLVVSVDTEEDNWVPAQDRLTVENIRELPRLDKVLGRIGARTTYFTTHQVAVTPWSAEIIRELHQGGRSEIGAHVHPWNTPPNISDITPRSSMLANLPREEQRAKIRVLTDTLTEAVGVRPDSFRAGRWGFDAGTAQAVIECGYHADSSVTPSKSWATDFGPNHIGAPLDVYRIDPQRDHREPASSGSLVEVPVSWGYAQRSWGLPQRLSLFLSSPRLQSLPLMQVAARLHLVNHAVLSPEIESVGDMIQLVRQLLEKGVRHLNLTFHSSTLRAGLNPFAKTQGDVERFYSNLESALEKIAALTPLRFATVAEAAALLAP